VWSDILLCGVSSVSSLSAQWVRSFHSRVVPLSLVLFRSTRPLRSFKRRQCLRAWSVAERQGHGALRPRDNSTHNSSLAPLLTLRHCQGDKSSPFSRPLLSVPEVLPISRDAPARLSKVVSTDDLRWVLSFSLSLSLSLFRSLALSRSLPVSLTTSLPLSLSRYFAISLSRSLALSLSLSCSSCLRGYS